MSSWSLGQVEQWQWAFMCTPLGWLPEIVGGNYSAKAMLERNPFSALMLCYISTESEMSHELCGNMWLLRQYSSTFEQIREEVRWNRKTTHASGNECKFVLRLCTLILLCHQTVSEPLLLSNVCFYQHHMDCHQHVVQCHSLLMLYLLWLFMHVDEKEGRCALLGLLDKPIRGKEICRPGSLKVTAP